ncbi:tetratricopeptide repeat protein [uncultured Anaerotruncus sp.]|uniref:tetratricopeptide repeat protein n=1 Tax=uncultured Anaerotruncus sp. TaxID=905011 RepID=UPI00280BC8DC|nr:tetratricopeptide repeat protein [uncultured Anaerotruncus sp.]
MKRNRLDEMNNLALEKLNQGDFFEAQACFRENTKEYPEALCFNNLGVFYTTEGLLLKSGKVRKSLALGIKYLERARRLGVSSPKNLLALGSAYYDQGELEKAKNYFLKAIELGEDAIAPYNLGVVQFLLRGYRVSTKYLEKSFEQSILDGKDMDESLVYVYSLINYDVSKGRNALEKVLAAKIPHIELDTFVLAYLCQELTLAKSLVEDMFVSWAVPPVVMAMVFDCMFSLGLADEAKKYKVLQEKILGEYNYNARREICEIRKIYMDKDYRDGLIKSYKFQPLLKRGCYYIGCKLHPECNL